MILMVAVFAVPSFAQTANEDPIHERVKDMPVFRECDDARFANYPYRCSVKMLAEYVENNVVLANPVGGQTKVLVSIVVEKDATISEVNIMRPPTVNTGNAETDKATQAALEAALTTKLMATSFQTPATKNGEAVRVRMQFSAPMNF